MTTDTGELFRRASQIWQAEPFDGDALDDALIAIVKLGQSAALDLAQRHLAAQNADLRGTAWQLLAITAQLGDEPLRTTVADLAIAAYGGEHQPDVLIGIVRALGGARDPRGLQVLTELATHPETALRFQVAADLPMVVGDLPDPSGLTALIALSSDADPQIRDWATFGLGTQTDADSEAIRAALWARTTDAHTDTRDEAVVALARRRDIRVLPIVVGLLAQLSAGTLVFGPS